MREIRPSGSEGGVALNPPSLPLSPSQSSDRDYFFPSQPRARSQSPARSGHVATASPVRRNP